MTHLSLASPVESGELELYSASSFLSVQLAYLISSIASSIEVLDGLAVSAGFDSGSVDSRRGKETFTVLNHLISRDGGRDAH